MNRSIGLIGLTFVAVSGVIGSGWLFAPLLTSRRAGPASIVAWIIGGVVILLLALSSRRLVRGRSATPWTCVVRCGSFLIWRDSESSLI